jgi:hypothetical protein
MSDARIGIGITADVGSAISGMQKVSSLTTILQAQFDRLQKLASLPNLTFRQQERLNQLLVKTQQELSKANKSFQVYSGGLDKVSKSTFNAQQASINFGRVVQDIPFGLQGVANNIDPLVASLGGPAGLGIAVSVVTSGLLIFGDTLKKLFASTSGAKLGVLGEAFKVDNLAKAVSDVKEITTNIELAKQGFLSKTDVLKQYNDTLGETIGKANSLDEAERLLVKNGDAYIKMTLYKSAANLAFAKAAEKALERQLKIARTTSDVDFVTTSQDGFTKALGENKRYLEISDRLYTLSLTKRSAAEEAEFQKISQERDRIVKQTREGLIAPGLQKDADELESIGKDFQKFAAELSKEFKLDFFGFKDTKGSKDALENAKRLAKAIQEVMKVPEGIVFKDFDTDKEALRKVKATIQGFFDGTIYKLKLQVVESFSEPPNVSDIATSNARAVYNEAGGLLGQEFADGVNATTSPQEIFDNSLFMVQELTAKYAKEFKDLGSKMPEIDLSESFFVNDEKIKRQLDNLKTTVASGLRDILNTSFVNIGTGIADGIGEALSGNLEGIGESLTKTLGGLLTELGKALIKYGAIKLGLDKILGPGGIAIGGGAAIALGVLAIAAGSALKNFGGKRALGGPVAGGRTYLVGENGPEMFTAPSNGIITPSGRVSGVGQGGMIFQLQGEFIQRGGDLVAAIAQTTRYQGRNS